MSGYSEFISDKDYSNISKMLCSFYKSYSWSCIDLYSCKGVSFEVKVEHRKLHSRTFDGKPCYATSRDFYCKMQGIFEKGVSIKPWNVHYGKHSIDNMGISDSAVYKVFDSFIVKYDSIEIIGYYSKHGRGGKVDITRVMVNGEVVYVKEI